MKKITKLFTLLLSLFIVFSAITPASVQAAAKTTLADTELVISVGPQPYLSIDLYNTNSKAKYTYTSSNKKIVTVNAKGKLTGVKAGTAKITVKQVLNKKTTTVGTCVVKVKKATIYESSGWWLALSEDAYNDGQTNLSEWGLLEYKNHGATYTYYSTNKKMLEIKKDGTVIKTMKAGKVKVTIKETYKKKTRTVGTYTVEIKKPQLNVENNTKDIALGESFYIDYCFDYYYGPYYVETIDGDDNDDNDALSFVTEDGQWGGELKGVNEGTMTVSIYMGKEKTDNNLLGTFTVNVKNYTTTDIIVSSESMSVDIWDEYSWMQFDVEPNKSTETPVVTSSNPSVVSIEEDSLYYNDGYGEYKMMYNSVGSATITITSGTVTKKIKVEVYDSDLE